jgi:hypothetical protein
LIDWHALGVGFVIGGGLHVGSWFNFVPLGLWLIESDFVSQFCAWLLGSIIFLIFGYFHLLFSDYVRFI